jgi:hypothetical protein
MTTTVAKPDPIRLPSIAAPLRSQRSSRRPHVLAGCILALALGSLSTWLIIAQLAGGGATDLTAATSGSVWTPPSLWAQGLDVIRLKKQLVRAGYSIKVDGNLDPVAKSARLDFTHVGNPAAWNLRFGLNRPTKFVERPLTGPGGQLDANGNLVRR